MSKILCTLCKNALKNNDDVYSTSCGHIFHFICLRECQSRSTCCPQCQHFNATSYKLYLTFDECNDGNLPNDCNDNIKIVELQKEIEECNNKYAQLQDKYLDSVRKLEERLKISNRSIAQRALVHSELEERIKTLEELNEYLSIDNDCKSKALTAKSNEFEKLQNSLKDSKKSVSVTSNDHIIKLEQKLQNLTIQLDKEIATSTLLSTDNKKLLKYVELMKTGMECQVDIKSNHVSKTMIINTTPNIKNCLPIDGDATENQQNLPENHLISKESNLNTAISQNSTDNDSVKEIISVEDCNSCSDPSSLNIHCLKNDLKYPIENETQNKSEENSAQPNNLPQNSIPHNTTENNSLKLNPQQEFNSSNEHNLKSLTECNYKVASSSDLKQSRNPFKTEPLPGNTNTNLAQISEELNTPNNSILITNFPKNKIQYPLKNFIVSLASTKEGNISLNDISKVHIKDRNGKKHQQLPPKITMFIEFKNSDIKTKFLINQVQIQQTFPLVEIVDGNEGVFKNCDDSKSKDQLIKSAVDIATTSSSTATGEITAAVVNTNQSKNNLYPSNNHGILISNFPKNKLQYPLKNLIVSLATTKEGYIYTNDVGKVYINDHNDKKHYQLPQNVNLIVEFKNDEVKTKFLLNRAQILQMFPSIELMDTNSCKDIFAAVNTINENASKSTDHVTKSAENITTEAGSKNRPINELNSCNNHGLLIKNFPKEKLEYPLKKFIVSLASTKETCINMNDINKVHKKNCKFKKYDQLPSKITLFIEFKNLDIKTKFFQRQIQIYEMFPLVEIVDTNEDMTKSCQSSVQIAKEPTVADVSKKCTINELNSSNGHSLIIKNFPKQKLQYPLINVILSLVFNKEGYISEYDVNKVYIKDRKGRKHHELPPKVTLIVEFKNSDIKMKFLLNQFQIYQMFPTLEIMDADNKESQNDFETKKDQSALIPDAKTANKENSETNFNNANGQRERALSLARTATNNNYPAVNALPRNDSNSQGHQANSVHLATTSLTKTTTKEISAPVKISDFNNSQQLRQRQRSVSSVRTINSYTNGQRQRTSSSARTSTNNFATVNTTHFNPFKQRSNSVYTANERTSASGAFSKRHNNNNLKPIGRQRQISASSAKINKIPTTRFNTTNWNDLQHNGHRQNSAAPKHNGQRQRSASLTRSTADTRTNHNSRSSNRNNSKFHNQAAKNPVNSLTANPPSLTAEELADKYAVRHGYRIKDVSFNAMQSSATLNIASATAIEDLLIYAREKLRGNGFEYVFRQNNEVRALRDRNDVEGINIMNTIHVNELLLSHQKK